MAISLGLVPNSPGLIGALVMSKFIPVDKELKK
jgi:hypothetical protein